MGWFFSIPLFIAGMSNGNALYFIAAGLFAIAGAIAFNTK